MKQISLSIAVAQPFGNLYRDRTVLIVIKNSLGNYLFGAKEGFFPDGICRLLGGGVDKGEDVLDAAVRELREELNLKISPTQLELYTKIFVKAIDENGIVYPTCISITRLKEPVDKYLAGDDVTKIVELTKNEVIDLAKKYETLSSDLWFDNGKERFNWGDYGKLYGPVHLIAIE